MYQNVLEQLRCFWTKNPPRLHPFNMSNFKMTLCIRVHRGGENPDYTYTRLIVWFAVEIKFHQWYSDYQTNEILTRLFWHCEWKALHCGALSNQCISFVR